MLNKSSGNMYEFVTNTWNTVKGACPHDCSYCYMKRWGNQRQARFDKKELKTDLGTVNFIFVGSSCDLFYSGFPREWAGNTLRHCTTYSDNRYLIQSKNTENMASYLGEIDRLNATICTTIETNRHYPEIMRNCPFPEERADGMKLFGLFPRFVTIEPIIDFDLEPMVELIKRCDPVQVNIGADSGNNGLPEPSKDKVLKLITELSKFTKIAKKRNLGRIIGK